ncbi:hypothetical protein AOC36_06210 [Erysipelothrix larvae]|uniref:DUF402 domain-containing protein n=1 Tax=Erysipelothrix larvae TaxID=1514105 RepID=A0A0X8H034_9FIRM|nr:DUF402 domain-containing protein [Erysipelothrix larvae]AMC93592.1 hypothetical protein AOC36_06210 [Erysipelothrix larvae]
MNPKIGDAVYVQSYKHDGSLHRTWSCATVVDVNDEMIVAITYKTWVVEGDGRRWFTREPAVYYFYLNRWYNVIAMIRKRGIYYYCNLATPSIYDGEAIKNIDYDLDVKVFPDGNYILLDEDEFIDHQRQMQYDVSIIDIVVDEQRRLVNEVKSGVGPFNSLNVYEYFEKFLNLNFEES